MSAELHILLGSIFMSVTVGGISFYTGYRRRRLKPLPTRAVATAAAAVQAVGVVVMFAGLLPAGVIALVASLLAITAYAMTPFALKFGEQMDTGMRAGRRG